MYIKDYELMGRTECKKCGIIFGRRFDEQSYLDPYSLYQRLQMCENCITELFAPVAPMHFNRTQDE